ncbi:Protoporphyrinogen IX oxidase [Acetobacteraceae bacterium EV16G]|uniref:Protoporphyrinogen IX oxidase n=1 Tax=Sorlinia euscelidii TaxID=3081148 RepID=A0ABU7TZJ0_9PROT
MDIFIPYLLWLKAFHMIAVIAWMAGMLYLPRLYVYHTQTSVGSVESARFILMERRLSLAIIAPAMTLTTLLGIILALIPGVIDWHAGWWWAKLIAVVGLFGFHGCCARWRRQLRHEQRLHSETFFRVVNEVPTLLMIIIVIAIVVRPWG